MAKAKKPYSTLLEILQGGGGVASPEAMQAFAALDPVKLPNADLTPKINRTLAELCAKHPDYFSGTQINRVLAELVAKHPDYFAGPLGFLVRIDDQADVPATDTNLPLTLEQAIKACLQNGKRPCGWRPFCKRVRDKIGEKAWLDRKANKPARGYGDRTIKRAMQEMGIPTAI
jgi:hypothetical protein